MDINNIPKEILDQIPPEFLDNLDQLMQETRKPVFGEKVIEEHLPALCRQAAAEGIVLLKNQGGALPLQKDAPVAVFGRVQLDYFYVGYGSGGDVNPPYTVNLMEGLGNAGVQVDQELAQTYAKWSEENQPFMGFWGNWPRYFEEMPLEELDGGELTIAFNVRYITDVLHRGATVYQAEGLYKHTEKTVIMTAQGKKQALHLQDVIRQKDPHAFVLVTNTSEIIGKGFRGGN